MTKIVITNKILTILICIPHLTVARGQKMETISITTKSKIREAFLKSFVKLIQMMKKCKSVKSVHINWIKVGTKFLYQKKKNINP